MADVDLPDHPETDTESFPPRNKWILRVAALALAAGAGFLLLRPSDGAEDTKALPSFDLPYLIGDGSLSNADLAGKPAVINFWASWCEPCRRESPLLDEFFERYSGEVTIVGVNVQDSPLAAKQFVREFELDYPMLSDLDQELFRPLGSGVGLPQTFFVTSSGEVVQKGPAAPKLGELDRGELEAAIAFLLGKDA